MDATRLQFLFDAPVLSVEVLDPGYTGHGSDVWRVQTADQDVIVRRSRLREQPACEFWSGCQYLFGIDPREMRYFAENLRMLHGVGEIPAPSVIATGVAEGREYLVVERMPGTMPNQFTGQPPELLQQLGRWLARVHSRRLPYFGNLAATRTTDPRKFHPRVAEAMRILVEREHWPSSRIRRHLDAVLEALATLPPPAHCCPVLVDLGPDQFLVDQGGISAIVDVEAYVVGPRELDFVALEYVLDGHGARDFCRGYRDILDVPDLSRVRPVYRYLYRLLGVQGGVALDRWLAQPPLF